MKQYCRPPGKKRVKEEFFTDLRTRASAMESSGGKGPTLAEVEAAISRFIAGRNASSGASGSQAAPAAPLNLPAPPASAVIPSIPIALPKPVAQGAPATSNLAGLPSASSTAPTNLTGTTGTIPTSLAAPGALPPAPVLMSHKTNESECSSSSSSSGEDSLDGQQQLAVNKLSISQLSNSNANNKEKEEGGEDGDDEYFRQFAPMGDVCFALALAIRILLQILYSVICLKICFASLFNHCLLGLPPRHAQKPVRFCRSTLQSRGGASGKQPCQQGSETSGSAERVAVTQTARTVPRARLRAVITYGYLS